MHRSILFWLAFLLVFEVLGCDFHINEVTEQSSNWVDPEQNATLEESRSGETVPLLRRVDNVEHRTESIEVVTRSVKAKTESIEADMKAKTESIEAKTERMERE